MPSAFAPVRYRLGIRLVAVAAMVVAPATVMMVAPAAAMAADPLTDPARKPNEAMARPSVVQKLYDCRTITDAAARLACFDAGVAELAQAEASRDVTLASREDIRKARRGLFGLNLPRIGLFSGGDKDGEPAEEINEVETTIEHARPTRQGGWMLVVDGGVRWVQTDQQPMMRDPKPGMKVKIRRATMGSFFANVDGQRAIRVQRQN